MEEVLEVTRPELVNAFSLWIEKYCEDNANEGICEVRYETKDFSCEDTADYIIALIKSQR